MDFSTGKNLATFFKSRRLSVVLIFLIIIFSIIGTHVPQRSALKPEVFSNWKDKHPAEAYYFEKLGFTHLFSSSIFVGLASLLFINILFCTGNMFDHAFRRLRNEVRFQKKAYISRLENSTVIETAKAPDHIADKIKSVLVRSGYKVMQEENYILAEKNRLGVLGIPLFHLSILFIILAAVYGSTGRMEGDMRLIEGQAFSEEHGNYMFINEGPFFNEQHQKFIISLEKFYPDYKDESGTLRGPAGRLAIIENGQKVKTDMVYSNHLMAYKGYTFLGNVYGLAPLLVLRNPDGRVYSGSYITASDPDNSGRYVASFEIGDTGLEGGLMVYMTANLASGKIMESEAEKTPVLFLKVFDQGTEIYDGTLRLNENLKIADKYLGFYDIKYWSNFYVVRDEGTLLVYAGIGFMIFALMISFFMIPRRVWIEISEDSSAIYIGARADKFRWLYEEEYFNIVNKIRERLTHGAD